MIPSPAEQQIAAPVLVIGTGGAGLRAAIELAERAMSTYGAYGFDLDTGARHVFRADAVILDAGGHTRTWRTRST